MTFYILEGRRETEKEEKEEGGREHKAGGRQDDKEIQTSVYRGR